jgi:hypothetical protein
MTSRASSWHRAGERLLRVASALLLAVYILPATVLPAVHVVDELLESRGCVACEEPEVATGPALRIPCSPDAPCGDRNHHHHNHPHHDPSHCTVCSTVGTAILDRPGPAATLPEAETVWRALAVSSTTTPHRTARRLELARGPPLA